MPSGLGWCVTALVAWAAEGQNGCQTFRAPSIAGDLGVVQILPEHRFSCGDGTFLMAVKVRWQSLMVLSTTWQCSDGRESELDQGQHFSVDSSSADASSSGTALFSFAITGVESERVDDGLTGPYDDPIFGADFVGKMHLEGYGTNASGPSKDGLLRIGPFGEEILGHKYDAAPKTSSRCPAESFATGVHVWKVEEPPGRVAAVQLVCAARTPTCSPWNIEENGILGSPAGSSVPSIRGSAGVASTPTRPSEEVTSAAPPTRSRGTLSPPFAGTRTRPGAFEGGTGVTNSRTDGTSTADVASKKAVVKEGEVFLRERKLQDESEEHDGEHGGSFEDRAVIIGLGIGVGLIAAALLGVLLRSCLSVDKDEPIRIDGSATDEVVLVMPGAIRGRAAGK